MPVAVLERLHGKARRSRMEILGRRQQAAVWLTFVAQVFIANFFNYRGPRGWVNQPLIQLPWWREVPAHLVD